MNQQNVYLLLLVNVSCKVSDVIRHFSDAFREADEDGDGFLSERELGIALRKLGHNPSEVEIRDLILTVDEDGLYYFMDYFKYGWIFISSIDMF